MSEMGEHVRIAQLLDAGYFKSLKKAWKSDYADYCYLVALHYCTNG